MMIMASNNAERVELKKGAWSSEEDQKLIAYIKRYGIWNWNHMPKPAGLARSGKSCRLRWVNYLNPNIKRGNFTKQEEQTIITLHAELGNRWSAIAAKLPGRTDNDIKNYWHSHLRKRLNLVPNPKLTQHATETSNINEGNLRNSSEMKFSLPYSRVCVPYNLESVRGSTETTAEFESLLLVQPYPLMEVMNTAGNFQDEAYREESVMIADSIAWLQQPTYSADNPQ